MNGQPINIETAFQKLSEINGFEGILFLSSQGDALAARFVEGVSSSGAEKVLADCLREVDEFARKVGSQGVAELTVRGQLRSLLLVRSGRTGFLTVVVGQETMHLALARLKMKETSDEVERALDEILNDGGRT